MVVVVVLVVMVVEEEVVVVVEEEEVVVVEEEEVMLSERAAVSFRMFNAWLCWCASVCIFVCLSCFSVSVSASFPSVSVS